MKVTSHFSSRSRWILTGCTCLLILGTAMCLLRTPGESWALAFFASLLLSLKMSSRRWTLVTAAAGTGITAVLSLFFLKDAVPDAALAEELAERLMVVGGMWAVAVLGIQRMRVESALREGEARSRAILDAAAEGIITIDEEGRLLSFNRAAERILGYSAAEVLGKSVELLVPPGRREQFKHVRQFLADPDALPTAGTTQERMTLRKDGTVIPMELSISEVAIGKRRIFTGIIRDITERKRTEEKLRESQRTLATLMANLPGMAYRCRNDESWTMLFVSEGCTDLTGYRAWDLVGNRKITYAKLIHPEDRGPVWDQVQSALKKRVPFQLTYRIITAQGLERWVWEQGQGVFSPEGSVQTLEGFIIDITDRKRAEAALRESEERFRAIADSAPVIIWVDGPDKRWTFYNKTWTDFTGKKTEPGDPETWSSCVHPDDVKGGLDAYDEAFAHWRPFECEYRLRRADGQYRVMHDSGIPHFTPGGEFAGYIGVCVDITDIRQAEAAVKERENVLTAILESTEDGILVVDAAGKVIHTNSRFAEMWRIPPEVMATGEDEKLLGVALRQLVDPDGFLAKVQDLYRSSTEDLDTVDFLDGRVFERSSRPLTRDGAVTGRVWCFRDITERRQAEKTIRAERDRAKTYLDVAATILVAIDADQKVTLINRRGCEILGWAEHEIVGQNWFDRCLPAEIRETVRGMFTQILAGELAFLERYENAVITRSGQTRMIEWHNTLLRDDRGRVSGTLSSGIDITERKQAEGELRESEARTRALLSAIPDMMFLYDRRGVFLDFHAADRKTLYVPPEQFLGQSMHQVMPPDVADRALAVADRARQTGAVQTMEYPLQLPTGERRHFEARLTACDDDRTLAIVRDVTERKNAEEALHLTKFSIDGASDTVFWIGPDGHFTNANEAACRTLGYTRQELESMAVWDIDPLLPREGWKACWDTLRNQRARVFESAHRTRDGRQFPVEITANYVEFNGREYCCAFVRDITERSRTERLLSIQRDLGLGLSSVSDLGSALQMCLRAAIEIGEMDGGGIYLVDKATGALDLACHQGLPPDFVNRVLHFDADSTNARLIRAGKPIYTTLREAGTSTSLTNGDRLHAFASIPILHENELIACLNVTSHVLDEIPVGSRTALEAIGAQIGSAIARVRAEEEARISEDRYRQLFEDSPLGLLEEDGSAAKIYVDRLRAEGVTDLRTYFDRHPEALHACIQLVKIVTANRPALAMLGGTTPQDLITRRSVLYAEGRTAVWRDVIVAFAEGQAFFESELHVATGKDQEKTFALRAVAAPGHEQDCGRIIVSILDISELVRVQRELSHAKRLETAGRIAGQIAHDLNNLLGPLVAYPDLIRGELPPGNHMQPLIDDMERAALQIAEINQELLTLGRRGH